MIFEILYIFLWFLRTQTDLKEPTKKGTWDVFGLAPDSGTLTAPRPKPPYCWPNVGGLRDENGVGCPAGTPMAITPRCDGGAETAEEEEDDVVNDGVEEDDEDDGRLDEKC